MCGCGGGDDLHGSLESLFSNSPVDDVPDGLDVVRTDILVLEVVSVLPDVDSDDGLKAGGCLEGVLVGAGGDLKLRGEWEDGLLLVYDNPSHFLM